MPHQCTETTRILKNLRQPGGLLARGYTWRYNFNTRENGESCMKTKRRASIIHAIKKEMPYLRERFGVERLALFGSVARDEADESSDIDIAVTLSQPLGFAFFHLSDYLESKLNRKVDLITTTTLDLSKTDPRRKHIAKEIKETLIDV